MYKIRFTVAPALNLIWPNFCQVLFFRKFEPFICLTMISFPCHIQYVSLNCSSINFSSINFSVRAWNLQGHSWLKNYYPCARKKCVKFVGSFLAQTNCWRSPICSLEPLDFLGFLGFGSPEKRQSVGTSLYRSTWIQDSWDTPERLDVLHTNVEKTRS